MLATFIKVSVENGHKYLPTESRFSIHPKGISCTVTFLFFTGKIQTRLRHHAPKRVVESNELLPLSGLWAKKGPAGKIDNGVDQRDYFRSGFIEGIYFAARPRYTYFRTYTLKT